jgi:hypothetical protein
MTERTAAPDRPSRRPGLATVLANPAYCRLFAAQTVSRWGDTFNLVALVVLVFRLTGSGLGVSGVVVAEIAPVLLVAPVAGVMIDRLPRVRVLVAADVWRMALATALPLVDQHLLAVYAAAFGLAAGAVFFNPAASDPHDQGGGRAKRRAAALARADPARRVRKPYRPPQGSATRSPTPPSQRRSPPPAGASS